MRLTVLLLSLICAAPAVARADALPASPTNDAAPVRPGRRRLGLGIELPLIGVLSGVAKESEPGFGFAFGGSVSWGVTSWGLVRLYMQGGRSLAGHAPLHFLQGATIVRRVLPAQWSVLEV